VTAEPEYPIPPDEPYAPVWTCWNCRLDFQEPFCDFCGKDLAGQRPYMALADEASDVRRET